MGEMKRAWGRLLGIFFFNFNFFLFYLILFFGPIGA